MDNPEFQPNWVTDEIRKKLEELQILILTTDKKKDEEPETNPSEDKINWLHRVMYIS